MYLLLSSIGIYSCQVSVFTRFKYMCLLVSSIGIYSCQVSVFTRFRMNTKLLVVFAVVLCLQAVQCRRGGKQRGQPGGQQTQPKDSPASGSTGQTGDKPRGQQSQPKDATASGSTGDTPRGPPPPPSSFSDVVERFCMNIKCVYAPEGVDADIITGLTAFQENVCSLLTLKDCIVKQ
jgi:hypothetical protein